MGLLKGDAHMTWMKYLEVLESEIATISTSSNISSQRISFAEFNNALYGIVKEFGLHQGMIYYQRRRFEALFSSVDALRASESPALDQYDVPGEGVGGGGPPLDDTMAQPPLDDTLAFSQTQGQVDVLEEMMAAGIGDQQSSEHTAPAPAVEDTAPAVVEEEVIEEDT